ncbi:hypothetical protein PCANC_01306 [Puccinia coronata f. sp. avenae]|uniref:Uncharacterized protein n=1 Tax=Puccinia coronata f. sp. avenae TaxID=200324 RepID=A0A2N5W625_9BASI|nr:hypothetical protein PCANC_01306 [Puccinia coronata f. sp. avenae]
METVPWQGIYQKNTQRRSCLETSSPTYVLSSIDSPSSLLRTAFQEDLQSATFRRPEGAGWAVPPSLFDPALDDVEIAGRTCAVKVTARRRQLGGLVSRQWGVN